MLHCTIMCNILNTNPLKERYMFDFTKQTKQFEELAQRIKDVNEFWINAMVNTTKELLNATKTK